MEKELDVRSEFPALLADPDVIFADAATGTQIHESVPDAMVRYLRAPNANLGGENAGGLNAIKQARDARKAAAAMFNCRPEEITIGANMTTLAFHLSHSLSDSDLIKRPGSANRNLVVTRLDHDANVTPWLRMAEKTGTRVRWAPLASDGCSLDLARFGALLDEDTVFVAIGYASNACGTVNPVKDMIKMVRAKSPRALAFVDAVHYAPHGLIDVVDLDCDFLACSPYKFFGPHTGLLYGRAGLMEQKLRPYKVSVATDLLPGPPNSNQQSRWETGTMNVEGAAGIEAAIEYIASLGVRYGGAFKDSPLRARLAAGYAVIGRHENALAAAFLEGIRKAEGLRLIGLDQVEGRTSTFALVATKFETVQDFNRRLLQEGLVAGASNFYAKYFSEDLGLEPVGGYVRVSLIHYNSVQEARRAAKIIRRVAKEGPK